MMICLYIFIEQTRKFERRNKKINSDLERHCLWSKNYELKLKCKTIIIKHNKILKKLIFKIMTELM